MIATIQPSAAHGRMTAPPSKSMAHRLLICAALAEGTSVIRNIELSQDILATIDCLKALGADVSCEDGKALVRGTKIRETDHAIPSCREADQAVLPCRESGSTLRFMFPLCLLNGLPYVLTGSGRLFERPLKVYEMICKEQGLFWKKEGNRLETAGILAAGEYEIPGNVSSQFISGLLFALPLLEKDSRIRLIRPVVSRPYIDMTVQALRIFGVQTAWEGDDTIVIPGGQKYHPQDVCVEGDYSNAVFFDALNLLGGDVVLEGLSEDSLQGDRIYRQYFDRIGRGFADIDLTDCPDLGPILMVLAAMRHGARFTGTARLKHKESDRGAAMKEELEKAGARVELADNEIRVQTGVKAPEQILQGHGDHRVVMALAVLLTKVGGSIRGAEAVRKSLPDFWDRLAGLGVKVSLQT
ncbi:MAG: 3-phosphoshikimate 1-carboxyvinyltransferase, partial [Lachnospiraceae bacterium]|nr:3-phosphoshikimate 1-carboxyvinyltransferase [Lachnospiraceae bacterium]